MTIPELEQQLLQLSLNDKLYIIQLLAQSLTAPNRNTYSDQPSKLSEFFRQSPLAEVSEELDFSRDGFARRRYRSLPRDDFRL
jgi:hypothetical protein